MSFFGLFKKKKKVNPLDIPQDVLKDFNEAERVMINSGGEAKPYQILFDISQKNKKYRAIRRLEENDRTDKAEIDSINSRADSGIDKSESLSQGSSRFEQRSSVQTAVAPVDKSQHSSNDRPNSNIKRGFSFRRPAARRRVSDY